MTVVNVRLEGPNEEAVRQAATQAGIQVSRVKTRDDCCHLYGSMVVSDTPPSSDPLGHTLVIHGKECYPLGQNFGASLTG